MILIAFALLCLLSVPLTGGRVSRLASIRVRGTWVPVVALAIQVLITVVIRNGSEEMHKAVHIATYVLIGVFLWCNRRLPGVKVIGLGRVPQRAGHHRQRRADGGVPDGRAPRRPARGAPALRTRPRSPIRTCCGSATSSRGRGRFPTS